MLLSEDDLHVRSSTSSALVVGLNLRPGFLVLWYQTPSVLLNIKEFLLFLFCLGGEAVRCLSRLSARDSTDRPVFSVWACRYLRGGAGVATCGGPRGHVLERAAHRDSIIKSAWAEELRGSHQKTKRGAIGFL